jgi:hypothetical protein
MQTMNRFHGIHQDGRFSRVQDYSSDESSARDEDEYEGDADDDSFASAQYSTGHSIAHSDIPDFSSVCSSLNSVLGGNASFSKHSYSSKSRRRFSKLPSTLRHIESQASLAYSIESSPRVSPLPMEEVKPKISVIPTKCFPTESPESCKNETLLCAIRPDDRAQEHSFSLQPPPPPSPPSPLPSSHYLPQPVDDDDDMGISLSPYPEKNIPSPPVTKKFLDLEYSEPNLNPFSPIKLEPNEDDTLSPSIARPSAIYTLRSSSTDTSPTCSTFSTAYMPSHVRSERLEKIKMKLRAIEGHVRPRLGRRGSSIVASYSYSTSPSSSQATSVRDVQSTTTMGAPIKTIVSVQDDPTPAIRIARETMSFCFLVYIVSVAYLMRRDNQVNSLQLQISQMQLVEQKLMVSVEAESKSMQLQIEKYKFMGRTLAIAQKSKQLEEFVSTPPNTSDEFGPIKSIFDLHAPTPSPSIISEDPLPIYINTMRAPTPTPSFSKRENLAPTLISHQKTNNALSRNTVKRYSIPMHDFFLVQSMLD